MVTVTDEKMMAVNDKPFNNLFSLTANERHKKNKASDQPDKLVCPPNHNKIVAAAKIADTKKNTIDFFGIDVLNLLVN